MAHLVVRQICEKNGISIGDKLTATYTGIEISGEIVGLVKSGEMMICVCSNMEKAELEEAVKDALGK